ncbi:uncharacterized protein LOC141628126 [Silene latifolia]|uniref:uncharacterized protein LOC141628126 n=1 Tax=Silene latifolia TaxID=37657 RepID=UPI003D781805
MRRHLVTKGFKPDYHVWIWHGEKANDMQGTSNAVNQGNKFDNVDEFEMHGLDFNNIPINVDNDNDDSHDKDNNVEGENIDRMMNDLEKDFIECPEIFQRLVDDSKKPLYPGSKFTRLSVVLKLCTLKAANGWSDKSFTALVQLLSEMLRKGNELPANTYRCKKVFCPLATTYKKMHACPNDCILFWKDYSDLDECPRYKAARYKIKAGDKKKGSPIKTLWYLPIIPRFMRFFANPKDAEYMVWHHEERNKDGKLRHVADAPQWRTIDRTFPDFGGEPRNLRLGLCTDGINPFGTLSTQHSSWPVMLRIYNLLPRLTTKSKYILLTLLISGPKQPGNDIDIYLAPLIEDLKLLWNVGVQVFDAASGSHFQMRAMLYCTINDFPAYGNLSGYRLKTDKGCPVCGDDTESEWLENCGKYVYTGSRRFLEENHQYRKRKKAFYGKTEHRPASLFLSGKEYHKRFMNITKEFGKPCRPPPDGVYHTKRSIFWDLPYWEYLSVRHCIYVMHVEKNVFDSIIGTLLNMPNKTKDRVKPRYNMVARGRFELLHVAIRSVLPKHVRQVIIKLCRLFSAINAKDIDPKSLDELQADIIVTLCELEMYFPISFLDIMVMTELSKRSHGLSDYLRWLAYGPKLTIISYEGYDINGFCFYTTRQDAKSTMQNSGITVMASSVEYVGKGKQHWADCDKGVNVDDMGFTLVDFNFLDHKDDLYILASQGKQIFYIEDPLDKKRSVVRNGKRRILSIDGVVDEEEYDQVDELSPFSTTCQNVQVSLPDDILLKVLSTLNLKNAVHNMGKNGDKDSRPKRKTRGPSIGNTFEEILSNQENAEDQAKNEKNEKKEKPYIDFNELGQPYGRWLNKFRSDMGKLARNIRIIKSWKDKTWNLEDDKKKFILRVVRNRFKDWKTRMTSTYIFPKQKTGDGEEMFDDGEEKSDDGEEKSDDGEFPI